MFEITEEFVKKLIGILDAGLVCGVGRPKPGEMCVMAAINYAMDAPHGDYPSCVGRSVRAFDIRLNDSGWSSPAARAAGMKREAIAKLGSNEINQKEFSNRLAIKTVNVLIPAYYSGMIDRSILDACSNAKTIEEAKISIEAVRRAYADAADAADAAAYAAAYAAAAYAAYAAAAADAAAYAAYAADAADDAAHAAAAAYAAYAAYAADAADDAAYAAYAADAADDAAYAAAADPDKWLKLSSEIGCQVLIDMNSPGSKFLYLLDQKEIL
jgi:hypothetical protein